MTVITSWSAQGKWVLQCPRATRGQRHPGVVPPSTPVSPALGHHGTCPKRGQGGGWGRPDFSPAAWMALRALPQPLLESFLKLSQTPCIRTLAEGPGMGDFTLVTPSQCA